jgi:hypothetical protein
MRSWYDSARSLGYLTCVFLVVASGVVRAEGGRKLVLGSVYRIEKNYVEVQVQAKEFVAVRTDASTTYFDSSVNKPAKPQDLGVGDQVAIRVVIKNGESVAEEIKFVPHNGARKTKLAPKIQ